MKIIHTSDWHIGKLVHQVHMTEDQKHILNNFIELIKEEKPDAVVIAGDLYDRSMPPVEAVELLDEVFSRIVMDLKTPIIAVAGNHDSPERIGFGSTIFMDKGLYIEGTFKKNVKKIILKDKHGIVNFYLVPYADPAIVRGLLENDGIKTHDDAFKAIIENIKEDINLEERNVMVTHGFIIGTENLETSESERPLSIGGTDCVSSSHFKDFCYTALGHLHGPQKVGSDKVRYAGSLLKYSFSETRQKKSVTIVELDEKGEVSVELKQLNPLRDMRCIEGKLEELIRPEIYELGNSEDYICVTLTDEGQLMEPMSKLRAVYPNVLQLRFKASDKSEEGTKTSAGKDFSKKTMLDLFEEFYKNIKGEEKFTEDKKEIIKQVIEKVEKRRGAL